MMNVSPDPRYPLIYSKVNLPTSAEEGLGCWAKRTKEVIVRWTLTFSSVWMWTKKALTSPVRMANGLSVLCIFPIIRHHEYKAGSGVCAQCPLRQKCTRSASGRTLKRHERQDELDRMFAESKSRGARKDIKTRQHLSERSFARSTRYGYKRARWRGWWRVQIQDFLIAAIQNIVVLIRYSIGSLSKSKNPTVRILENLGWRRVKSAVKNLMERCLSALIAARLRLNTYLSCQRI